MKHSTAMKSPKTILLALPVIFAFSSQSARAENAGWFLELGPAHVGFSEGADVSVAGQPVPGSDAHLSDNQTLAAGLGYRFQNNFSVIAIAGIPPTTKLKGAGALEGMEVGEVTYGPLIVAANYHFPAMGGFSPYVGVGYNYTIIFDTDSGADIAGFDADNASGAVLRAGFDYRFNQHHGVFLSVNKIFVSADATGTAPAFGGAPVTADVTLDPLIIHAGWRYQF